MSEEQFEEKYEKKCDINFGGRINFLILINLISCLVLCIIIIVFFLCSFGVDITEGLHVICTTKDFCEVREALIEGNNTYLSVVIANVGGKNEFKEMNIVHYHDTKEMAVQDCNSMASKTNDCWIGKNGSLDLFSVPRDPKEVYNEMLRHIKIMFISIILLGALNLISSIAIFYFVIDFFVIDIRILLKKIENLNFSKTK